MKALILQLIQIMQRLVDEHRGLVRDGEAHKCALVLGDTAAIAMHVDIVSKRVEAIYELEQQRSEVAKAIGEFLEVKTSDVNISFLAQHLEPGDMEQLHRLSSELGEIILRLARLNEQNRSLTEQSMHYLHKTVELVASAINQDVYGTGTKPTTGGHLFDVQA